MFEISSFRPHGCALLVAGVMALFAMASPAAAQVAREQDIIDLRLGQRVLVDDGSCPNGQIKEVMGANLTEAGITRTRKCIPRQRKG